MNQGGWMPYSAFTDADHFGAEVFNMPDEEELEQRITEMLDREEVRQAILSLEIKQMDEAIKDTERVCGK